MKGVSPLFLAAAFGMSLGVGCKKEPPIEVPPPTHAYSMKVPAGFPAPTSWPENPMTVEGVNLGRRLYYDEILSTNGRSCSSCHHQEFGFTEQFAGPGNRGILPHVNLAWKQYFGWEGGGEVLDQVCLADLEPGNAFLAANPDSIRARFERSEDYQDRFWGAFGVKITEVDVATRNKYIAFAVAQFMRTQVSGNSKFDQYLRHEPGVSLTQSEFNGYVIFFTERGECFHCHSLPLFSDQGFHNNGLDSTFGLESYGRFALTGDSSDLGKFLSPTLRNISLTGPYMHDNRFTTLSEVVDFYSEGIAYSPTLNPLLHAPTMSHGFHFSPQEKTDLIAFLQTLTDSTFLADTALTNPF